jgi:hypothetical protein
MPVVIHLLASLSQETQAPVLATADVPIGNAENKIDTKMNKLMKAFEPWILHMS